MTQADTALEPKRHAKTRSGQAAKAARPNGGAAAAAGVDPASFRDAILAKLTYSIGKDPAAARDHDWFAATALAVRDHVIDRWMDSTRATYQREREAGLLLLARVPDRAAPVRGAQQSRPPRYRPRGAAPGSTSTSTASARPNRTRRSATAASGGLPPASWKAWLASRCRPTATASATITACSARPSSTAGSTSCPEDWLAGGNPWEFERPEVVYPIGFGGSVEHVAEGGVIERIWQPAETVQAVAYDTPVVGWRGRHVNTLRLWSARAADPLQLETFNLGDHVGALADRARAEAISRGPLSERRHDGRPGAAAAAGVLLHLGVAAGPGPPASAALRRPEHPAREGRRSSSTTPIRRSPSPELMRLLVDEHALPWEEAWAITTQTLSYTNHTLLPEALETWPVPLMERLLPRHMQIIYLINWLPPGASCAERAGRGDAGAVAAVSLIDETHGRRVRMGHLAFLGSHKVNGVSALHTELHAQDRVQGPARARTRTASSTRPTASPSGAGCIRPTRA